MSKVEEALVEQGVVLPDAPKPVAVYVPGVVDGDTVYVSGQLPLSEGKLVSEGKVGAEVTLEQAQQAARQSAINCLAVIKACVGDLDKVERVVKLTGFVAADPSFTQVPQVVNGASELVGAAFGEAGTHARSAVGVAVLPMNAPCEVEVIVRLKSE